MSPRTTRGERGQSLVELALLLPGMLFFILVCFQLAFVYYAYLSTINSGRDISRWLSAHANTTDAVTTATIKSRLASGLDPTKLTVAVSPACGALVNGKCPNRPVGSQLAVTLTYDASGSLFLPTTWGIGDLSVTFPTRLPAYTMYLAVEPG
jgi:Flp pilus assembly protein TadG